MVVVQKCWDCATRFRKKFCPAQKIFPCSAPLERRAAVVWLADSSAKALLRAV
jgi:hypothetical protein